MQSFQDLTPADLIEAFNGSRTLEFLVSKEITQFPASFQTDTSKPFEIPPTPIALNKDTIAWAVLHGAGTPQGHYATVVLVVYWTGGKIVYSKHSDNDFVAKITWPPASKD